MIPPAELAGRAISRLQEIESRASSGSPFTSDLSPDELVLMEDAGFEPLHLVMGSSIYHIGFQWAAWNESRELDVLTRAMYEARRQAMGRLEAEAAALGAHGVVGVRIEIDHERWGHGLAEFLVLGTAVRARAGDYRVTAAQRPFTSDLGGQDFYTLWRAGYRPLGLVMGNCVYHVARQGLGAVLGRMGQNVELPNFTEAMYASRESAMKRMQDEAARLGAEGIVGVRIEQNAYLWGGHTMEFSALGTAVAPRPGGPAAPRPALRVPLEDAPPKA
ncbi:MAG: heavy metal-binding domain-containing protein [Candidatus Dormibacterales bacterium]